jgi:short-subunit dehydrogenase
MKTQGVGHIVNTASTAGLMATGEGFAVYGTSKYAIVGLSINLRIDASMHRGMDSVYPIFALVASSLQSSREEANMARHRIFQMRNWRKFGPDTNQWIPNCLR